MSEIPSIIKQLRDSVGNAWTSRRTGDLAADGRLSKVIGAVRTETERPVVDLLTPKGLEALAAAVVELLRLIVPRSDNPMVLPGDVPDNSVGRLAAVAHLMSEVEPRFEKAYDLLTPVAHRLNELNKPNAKGKINEEDVGNVVAVAARLVDAAPA